MQIQIKRDTRQSTTNNLLQEFKDITLVLSYLMEDILEPPSSTKHVTFKIVTCLMITYSNPLLKP